MYQDSPASSCVGSFGRWRWIQQNYMPQNRLRETRNGVDYVLVSKVSHAEGEEEISEDIMRYAVCSVSALLLSSHWLDYCIRFSQSLIFFKGQKDKKTSLFKKLRGRRVDNHPPFKTPWKWSECQIWPDHSRRQDAEDLCRNTAAENAFEKGRDNGRFGNDETKTWLPYFGLDPHHDEEAFSRVDEKSYSIITNFKGFLDKIFSTRLN